MDTRWAGRIVTGLLAAGPTAAREMVQGIDLKSPAMPEPEVTRDQVAARLVAS
jgi:hypothetical protein